VSDLDGVSNNLGKTWTATVTITVRDNLGNPVSGANVSGSFTAGGSVSCTTGPAGTCTVTSAEVRKNVSSITYTVQNVTGPLPYNPAANSDPDGDSDGTSITVFK
jgi:hypothetical protein